MNKLHSNLLYIVSLLLFAIEWCKIWKELLFAIDIIYLYIDAHRLMVVDRLAVFDEYSRDEEMAIFCVTTSHVSDESKK